MAHVCILYAVDNQAFASKIEAALFEAGHVVSRREVDDDTCAYLGAAEGDLEAMIVIWSGASIASPLVISEARSALARRVLTPLSIGKVEPPASFQHLWPIDLSGWAGSQDDPRWRFVMDEVNLSIRRSASGYVDDLSAPEARVAAKTRTAPSARALFFGAAVALSALTISAIGLAPFFLSEKQQAGGERPNVAFVEPSVFGSNEDEAAVSPRARQTADAENVDVAADAAAENAATLVSDDAPAATPAATAPATPGAAGPVNATDQPDDENPAPSDDRANALGAAPSAVDAVDNAIAETGALVEGEATIAFDASREDVFADETSDAFPDDADVEQETDAASPDVAEFAEETGADDSIAMDDAMAAEDLESFADVTPPPPSIKPQTRLAEAAPATTIVDAPPIPAEEFASNEAAAGPAPAAAIANEAIPDAERADDAIAEIIDSEAEPDTEGLDRLIVETTVLAQEQSAAFGAYFRECLECPDMAELAGGSFTMGTPFDEAARSGDELAPRTAQTPARFALSTTEITFKQWDACVAEGGCNGYRARDPGWGRGDRPVVNVSIDDARAYAAWLTLRTGQAYRLPTEAEWEYAARAGANGPFSFNGSLTTARANYHGRYAYNGPAGQYRQRSTPAASFEANAFGLHDMHGNVWEWTDDCWSTDAAPAADCSQFVLKGGAWNTGGWRLRAGHRIAGAASERDFDKGFRVARTLP